MPLSPPELEAFLAETHTAVVATVGRAGRPQLSTVWYRWDGAALWIATNSDRAKARNLRRDPRITVLIDAPPRETSVVIYGRAEIITDAAAAYDGALPIVGRYVEDARAYLDERSGDPRVLLKITPDKIVSWKLE